MEEALLTDGQGKRNLFKRMLATLVAHDTNRTRTKYLVPTKLTDSASSGRGT